MEIKQRGEIMTLNDDWTIWIRTQDSALSGWRWAALGEDPPTTNGRQMWCAVKIAREVKQAGRNAWHLQVSLADGRIARSSEFTLLRERDPELAAVVETRLGKLLRESILAPEGFP